MLVGAGLGSGLRVSLACIELVSASFRGVTLSLRLVCNMCAGHALLGLVIAYGSRYGCDASAVLCLVCCVVVSSVFGSLKVLTCSIQADVLVRLLALYWWEFSALGCVALINLY